MNERRTSILLTTIAAAGLGLASATNAATIDFDVQSDFDDNFAVPATAGEVVWSSDAGIGGAAGRINSTVATNEGETAWFDTAFDLDDGAMTTSVFFRGIAYTDTSASRIAIGLAENYTTPGSSNLRDNSLVQVRLLKNNATTAKFEIRDEPGASSTSGVTLTDGNWYRLSLTVEKGGAAGEFDITATLEDWGADGTTDPGVAIATASGTRVRSTFYTGNDVDPLYVGFMGQDSGGGTDAFDNFTTTIPEPATLGLSALGALVLLTRRHH